MTCGNCRHEVYYHNITRSYCDSMSVCRPCACPGFVYSDETTMLNALGNILAILENTHHSCQLCSGTGRIPAGVFGDQPCKCIVGELY